MACSLHPVPAGLLPLPRGFDQSVDSGIQSHRWVDVGSCGGEFAVLCACGVWGAFAVSAEIARSRECEGLELERASAARGALVHG